MGASRKSKESTVREVDIGLEDWQRDAIAEIVVVY